MKKYVAKNWYWLIGFISIFVAIAIFTALAIFNELIHFALDRSVIKTLLFTAMGIAGICVLWPIWVCPVLESNNPTIKETVTPKQKLGDLKLFVSTIFLTCLLGSVLVIYDVVEREVAYSVARDWKDYDWTPVLRVIGKSVICIQVILLITWLLWRTIHKRFKAAIIRMNLCFECGYDLRGSVSVTCPECGKIIPDREDSENG